MPFFKKFRYEDDFIQTYTSSGKPDALSRYLAKTPCVDDTRRRSIARPLPHAVGVWFMIACNIYYVP